MNSAAHPRRLLLVNGSILDVLGTREPEIYGSTTLSEVEELTRNTAAEFGYQVNSVQSNHEGILLDAIHERWHQVLRVVINAGAFTHTSVATRTSSSSWSTCSTPERRDPDARVRRIMRRARARAGRPGCGC